MTKHSPSENRWKSIRLELGATREFPQGSASRAYMLHLPLREDGTIDETALQANPLIAGFRRFWPNEPDRSGFVVRSETGWLLSFQPDGEGTVFPIAMDRLLPGDQVIVDKCDGGSWRYRVVDLPSGSALP